MTEKDLAPTLPAARGSLPQEGTRTRIKICGLTRAQDVDTAVAAGVDAIGFVRYPPSGRYVTAEQAAQLASRLPPMVTPVLLYVNADADDIAQDCGRLPGAVLQFHGDEDATCCAAVARRCARPYWRAARIPAQADGSFDLLEFVRDFRTAAAIVLDAQVEGFGGGGRTFDWSRLPPNVPAHLVLSGGLSPANVGDGLRALRGRGRSLAVDISSGVEIDGPDGKPLKGLKDATKIRQFVAAVRAADALFAGPTQT